MFLKYPHGIFIIDILGQTLYIESSFLGFIHTQVFNTVAIVLALVTQIGKPKLSHSLPQDLHNIYMGAY